MPSTAARNEASFAFDGLLKPLIFRTNWSEAARISSGVTGGSKLNKGLMFLHIVVLTVTKPKARKRSNSAQYQKEKRIASSGREAFGKAESGKQIN